MALRDDGAQERVCDLVARLDVGSPLGPRAEWSERLKTTFDLLAVAPVQIVLFWGSDYIALYNDAYAPTIGEKHPRAFGRPAQENWSELWDDLEPLLKQVRLTGDPVFAKDRPFYIERHGYPETVTFDISYSAVPDDNGKPAGVLCIVNETTERTAYEQALRESEARFRNMADHAPLITWVVDDTGACTYLSARWYQFTGQTPEQALGFGWLEVTHPDDRARTQAIFTDAFTAQKPFTLEYRLRHADGSYHWAIDSAEPRIMADGRFAGYVGSVIDIDERHQMEQRLRDSEAQLRAITNSVDQMIWATRPDGYHDFYNDRWYEFTGIPHGSTDGAAWNGMFHPDDQDRAWELWAKCLEAGVPYHIEYRLRHRTGAYRWVIGRANPVRDASGEIIRWYGTCTDIHELKTAEIHRSVLLAVQEEAARLDRSADLAYAASRILAEALGASRVGYGTVDLASETICVEQDWTAEGLSSLSGKRLFADYGHVVQELKQGRPVVVADVTKDERTSGASDLFAHEETAAFVSWPLWERNELGAVLFVGSRHPKTWLPEELELIRDVGERTRQAVERRRAEDRLVQLTASLEQQVLDRTDALRKSEELLRQSQKMEAVGQLTGGIAHDFNNNLAVVIGGLSLLQRRLRRGDSRDVERLIDGAMDGAQRAATLTQRLLAFSRQQPLSPEAIDVNRMLFGMNELLMRSLGEHIRIEMVHAPELWRTSADIGQLENAVLNLAVNARDAMPDGGKLTIQTANARLDGEQIGAHPVEPGDYVLISVADTGAGMPPEVIERAFEPFFTTKEVGKGTGLGLSQVFGFVRQTGGHVRIDSRVDVGTCVTIYLPRHEGEEASEHIEPRTAATLTSRSERILLVEDDEHVRRFTAEALKELGYDVTVMDGPLAALELFRRGETYDLLLTDVRQCGGS
eukprot:g3915.t1